MDRKLQLILLVAIFIMPLATARESPSGVQPKYGLMKFLEPLNLDKVCKKMKGLPLCHSPREEPPHDDRRSKTPPQTESPAESPNDEHNSNTASPSKSPVEAPAPAESSGVASVKLFKPLDDLDKTKICREIKGIRLCVSPHYDNLIPPIPSSEESPSESPAPARGLVG